VDYNLYRASATSITNVTLDSIEYTVCELETLYETELDWLEPLEQLTVAAET
jgi:hypothetical protein